MSLIKRMDEILHKIRVKLYPSYLQHTEGKYIARADDEAQLSIEQIATAAKTRGGFTGSYDDMIEYVKLFLDESMYQLARTFSVNNLSQRHKDTEFLGSRAVISG